MKAAAVAAFPNREPTMLDDASSSTTLETDDAFGASAPTHPLDELVLHAHRPFQDNGDPRPLPEPEDIDASISGAMNAIAAGFTHEGLRSYAWGLTSERVRLPNPAWPSKRPDLRVA